ncbi:hypothetical protein GCM10009007_18790 [Formosimonas limnophila]|uniref:Uncharacterized protein n=1 Tax=Formosimonas limnophila TaxID=1384487 RepID=A0A8J3FZ22_9BURK|nr:hypothetical protein [Formosimonas limnophila]GHA78120.1 hypothetical protein GCM10009007_18790 [Formosimonas limnophila]
MVNQSIRPSTIVGIKRLATQYQKQQTTNGNVLSRSAALNLAAQVAGFENFRHAQNQLKRLTSQTQAEYPIHLTAYWQERQGQQIGKERLSISLHKPLNELLKPADLKKLSELHRYEQVNTDHLQRSDYCRNQSMARSSVCTAARILQFIAATGLRPSTGYSKAYPIKKGEIQVVPGQDHVSIWLDGNKRYLIVDEPYGDIQQNRFTAREAWCRTHGYQEAKPDWLGMHNPFGGTELYLLSHNERGVPLDPILTALAQIRHSPSEQNWQGESSVR